MKAEVEIYKGIEFIRLSAINKDQANSILSSSFAKRTIKILRDQEILSDCLPYSLYLEWYHQFTNNVEVIEDARETQKVNRLRFALK